LASQLRVAGVDGAWVVVVAVLSLSKVALSVGALVDGACVVIVAGDSVVDTLVGLEVARVDGACVGVVANWELGLSLDDSSGLRAALVVGLSLAVSDWCLETSLLDEGNAELVVVARVYLSGAVLRDKLWNCLASLLGVAVVNGALVSVLADFLGVDDSVDSIAGLDGACVLVSQLDWNVEAVSSVDIA
jgi:hypothetical protein